MNILGISAFYHDSAAALVRDGEIIAAAQQERFSRKKHDHRFPAEAVSFCLKQGGITPDELDYVVFYDKPFIKFERILQTYLAYAPYGIGSFIKAMPLWIKKKLWIKDFLQDSISGRPEILFLQHHQSHAASAFFPSPFDDAAFLTVDGVGEWATASFGAGGGNRIEINSEINFPHSLGLLYSAFTYYTGFKVNSGEYKLMGLAPYGKPLYKDIIYSELIDVKDDGSFRLNMKYFNYCAGLTMTNRKFDKLFGGPPRKPETKMQQRYMDMAASVQEVTEEIMMKMAAHVHRETGKKNLCLAGGVALNCVANGRLLRESPFENIWIQPAAGDAGGALGAALFVWYQHLGNERVCDGKDMQKASLLGPEFKSDEIEKFLKDNDVPYQHIGREALPDKVAELIADEKVVGLFNGRMEFGPRALGNRSIVGDARSEKMQEVMNLKIKFRESFRPFAPSVLADRKNEFFDIDSDSPYMLLTAQVQDAVKEVLPEHYDSLQGFDKLKYKRSSIPAVTHVDYSARLQTVSRQDNELYYDIISAFYCRTGVPVIINTSFNVRGEPIVCTYEDAFRCFMRTNMDFLVLGDILLDKSAQQQGKSAEYEQQQFELD